MTRRSITGLILFVRGNTLVTWVSRHQGCNSTSTHCAEFLAMRGATVEEDISLCYMLCCLGIYVSKENPTNLYGDDRGAIQSNNIPDGEFKKMRIAILCQYVREAIAALIINPIWLRSHKKIRDVCTTILGGNIFEGHIHEMMA